MKTVRIFFSSPGDVAEERTIAHRVVRRLSVEFAGAFRIETVIWEREPLLATAGFQEQLERPAQADIFVAILWSRLGTPLPIEFARDDGSRFLSGTEFEFEDAYSSFQESGSPRILAYRKTATPIVSLDDEDAVREHLRQKKSLDRFMENWFSESSDGTLQRAVHAFDSPGDFEELLEIHLRKLIQKLGPDAAAPADREALWTRGSPFRGLEAFGFEHSGVFFGRTRAVASVLDSLRKQATSRRAFVLVVGASGGGKSSLVRAGVVPMLVMPGVVPGISDWRRATMRPSDAGGDAMAGLAQALCREAALPELRDSAGGSAGLLERFRHDEFEALTGILAALNSQYGKRRNLVLVIDQLEELFNQDVMTDEDRDHFMGLVEAFARSGSVWVVSTMRSDFYPRCIQLPRLVALKEGDGQFDLQQPTRPEIGQMIRLPAESAGLVYETDPRTGERLDERIRDDTVENPKALPLLEFTLQELYEQRTPAGVLTFAAYRKIGGLEGSLSKRAETVFRDLPKGVRAALPEVLDALAAPAGGAAAGLRRKRARLHEIANPDARTMIRAFVDARLFSAELNHDEEVIVDVAHEALLDHWPRVLDWARVNQETLQAHHRIATATRNWVEAGRSRDLLLQRGRPVSEARMLLARKITLDRNERDFIAASLLRSRQLRWVSYGVMASVAVFAIVAGIAAWLATAARDEAESRRGDAQAMVNFMLQDLRERLEPIGQLDLLDSVISTVLETLRERDPTSLTDDELASLGYALRQHGDVEDSKGNREAALSAYRESLAISQEQQRREPDSPERLVALGNAWFGVGYISFVEGDFAGTKPAFEAYLAIAERLVGIDPGNDDYQMELNYAESNLGTVELELGNHEEALAHFEASARIGRELTRNDPGNVEYKTELSESLSWISSLRESIGEFRTALRTREEAAELDERIVALAPDDMRWRNLRARGKFLLAELLAKFNDEAALPYATDAIAELSALATHDPANVDWQRDLAYAQTVMAHVCYQFGLPQDALTHANTAVTLARSLHETDREFADWRARLGRAQIARALALHALGDNDKALSALAAARSVAETTDQSQSLLASVELMRGKILASGELASAKTAFEAAMQLARDGNPRREDALDNAVWAEASLRSDTAAAAESTVRRLLEAGYRERDFIDACAPVIDDCTTLQALK